MLVSITSQTAERILLTSVQALSHRLISLTAILRTPDAFGSYRWQKEHESRRVDVEILSRFQSQFHHGPWLGTKILHQNLLYVHQQKPTLYIILGCGGTFNGTDQRTIMSPGYNINGTFTYNCEWKLRVNQGQKLNFSMSELTGSAPNMNYVKPLNIIL